MDWLADGLGLSLFPSSDSVGFGFRSGVPGDGASALAIITPSACPAGLGVGIVPGGGDGQVDPVKMANGVRSLLPLP